MERRETKSGRDSGNEAQEGEDLIVDGFKVPRRVSDKWDLASIRKAIATIDFWYPNKRKLQRGVNFAALLHTVLRKQDEEAQKAAAIACSSGYRQPRLLSAELRPSIVFRGQSCSCRSREGSLWAEPARKPFSGEDLRDPSR